MRQSEIVHKLCSEIGLLYDEFKGLDDAHRNQWIIDGLKQLSKMSEPLAFEALVESRNRITRQNLRHYEIIRNDQRNEDERDCRGH